MDFCVRLLGLDLFSVHVNTDAPEPSPSDDPGDCTTMPVGFSYFEQPDMVGLPDRYAGE